MRIVFLTGYYRFETSTTRPLRSAFAFLTLSRSMRSARSFAISRFSAFR
ncbi:MAG: hypothetical protein WBX50_00240 [Candidatus Deferrimicrobiaceae bacterium]